MKSQILLVGFFCVFCCCINPVKGINLLVARLFKFTVRICLIESYEISLGRGTCNFVPAVFYFEEYIHPFLNLLCIVAFRVFLKESRIIARRNALFQSGIFQFLCFGQVVAFDKIVPSGTKKQQTNYEKCCNKTFVAVAVFSFRGRSAICAFVFLCFLLWFL